MTYGWAILIVIIVAAALYALGVFNPATFTGRTPTGFTELGAPSDWDISESTGILKYRLSNNKKASQVTVKTIVASLKGGATYTFNTSNCTGDGNYMIVGPGGYRDIDTYCTNIADNNLTFTGLTAGTSYSINMRVTYNEGGLDHPDTGTVTGVVS